jgi:hypothetical protein
MPAAEGVDDAASGDRSGEAFRRDRDRGGVRGGHLVEKLVDAG